MSAASGPGLRPRPHGPGCVQRLDPRSKLVVLLGAALAAVLLPAPGLAALASLLAALAGAARLSPLRVAGRLLLLLPFTGAVALARAFGPQPWAPASIGLLLARSAVALLATIVLVSTTPFPALLSGLRSLGVPRLFVALLAFTERYLHLLGRQAGRMVRSAAARGLDWRRKGRIRVSGALIGSLLLRSLDRGERVHLAMLSRGFEGELPPGRPLALRPADIAFAAAGLLLVAAIARLGP